MRATATDRSWAALREEIFLWVDAKDPKWRSIRRTPWTFNPYNMVYFTTEEVDAMTTTPMDTAKVPFDALSTNRVPFHKNLKNWRETASQGSHLRADSVTHLPLHWLQHWYSEARERTEKRRLLLQRRTSPEGLPGPWFRAWAPDWYHTEQASLSDMVYEIEKVTFKKEGILGANHYAWLSRDQGMCAQACGMSLYNGDTCTRPCDREYNHMGMFHHMQPMRRQDAGPNPTLYSRRQQDGCHQ